LSEKVSGTDRFCIGHGPLVAYSSFMAERQHELTATISA
jgi:hypothetical protein